MGGKKIFLLGGPDLEMITIRDILKQKRKAFYDHHNWKNYISTHQVGVDFHTHNNSKIEQ